MSFTWILLITAHEEMNGVGEFIEELPDFLPGCQPASAWLWNVETPAFKPKVTEFFSRCASQSAIEGSA